MDKPSTEKVYKTRKGDATEYKQFPDKLEKLKILFEKMASKHDKPLSKITILNYVNKLNKLSTIILGHGYDGTHEWLYKPDEVIQKVDEKQLSGKKDFFSPVVKLLKYLDAPQDYIAKYQKAMATHKDVEYTKRKENTATEKEVDNSMPLQEIKEKIKIYKPTNEMELIYKLICALYFENSLVPRNDLPLMKFVSSNKKPNQMNTDFNYITLDKNKVPLEIIMNNYKSRNTYGRQKFPITEPVRALLKQYIEAFKKQAGDFLFVMKSGEPFKKSNFTDLIGQSTEEVLGKRINIDLIRKIQITNYFEKNIHSIQEDEEDARKYLHSTNIHREYLKVNLPQEDKDDD